MAPFEYLPKADRMSLAHYVQSLGSFSHGSGGPEAIETLSEELAAAGERTPNKIPVSLAISKLEADFKAPPPLLVPSEERGRETERLGAFVIDPSRAALTLGGSQSWRKDSRELAPLIVPGSPTNGFSVSTATQSVEEWNQLHTELKQAGQSDTGSR